MVRVAAEHGVGAPGAPVAVAALQSLPTDPVLALTAPAHIPWSLLTDPASTGRHHPALNSTVARLRRLTGSEAAPGPGPGEPQHGGQQDGEQHQEHLQ